jgi:hypothetical protein
MNFVCSPAYYAATDTAEALQEEAAKMVRTSLGDLATSCWDSYLTMAWLYNIRLCGYRDGLERLGVMGGISPQARQI